MFPIIWEVDISSLLKIKKKNLNLEGLCNLLSVIKINLFYVVGLKILSRISDFSTHALNYSGYLQVSNEWLYSKSLINEMTLT